eukprot:CAMPEP_0119549502 /NCGR_PEP_ID=MMETSP1352-20130426/3179_1 /TAXON_ID=265584 /ORGANISM="Stauroneis constricta, Strain CCMP1120" /LENGTH=45 /DNA_ID= /DNA_START= /DNA_END= /DNA_ORIENTATION=
MASINLAAMLVIMSKMVAIVDVNDELMLFLALLLLSFFLLVIHRP